MRNFGSALQFYFIGLQGRIVKLLHEVRCFCFGYKGVHDLV